MKISAIIITFNEERNIKRCLSSLQSIADEIIIIDSFSTDNTAEICKGYSNVRLITYPWAGYSGSKNYGNSLAEHDYILSLDADEALSPELQKSICQLKQNRAHEIYQINRRINYCGRWIRYCGWYPDWKTRLFPKNQCQWVGEFVHETLSYPKELKEVRLQGDCYHYSYYSFTEHRQRADKYSLLTAQKLYKKGKSCSFFKPYLSAMTRFLTMYLFRLGFLDGWMGFKIAQISAQSNIVKYKELIRLNHEKKSAE